MGDKEVAVSENLQRRLPLTLMRSVPAVIDPSISYQRQSQRPNPHTSDTFRLEAPSTHRAYPEYAISLPEAVNHILCLVYHVLILSTKYGQIVVKAAFSCLAVAGCVAFMSEFKRLSALDKLHGIAMQRFHASTGDAHQFS